MLRLEPVWLQLPDESATALIRVISDTDVAYGEATLADPEMLITAVDFFADSVAYTDPLDLNLVWQRLFALVGEYTPDPLADYMAVLGAIDTALWDLAARAMGVPCYRLAGGLRAARLDCTAGGLDAADDDLALAAKRLRQQFGAVAMRLTGDPQRDVPAIHRLRKAVGERGPFMVDAGAGYADLASARQVGEAVEQVEGFWYENPLPAGRWDDYAELRRTLGTGLAGGRTLTTLAEADAALRAEAVDILIADVRWCGGLSAARRLADMTQRHGVRLSLQAGASPLAQLASAHLAAANWHVGPLQVDPSAGPLAALLEPAPLFDDGFLLVPDSSGLGGRVSEAFIEQHQVELPDEPTA